MRRVIAYIYHYKAEEDALHKCENTGFCRVENKDGHTTVNVCLKDGCGVEGRVNIYSLKAVMSNDFSEKTYQRIKIEKLGEAGNGTLNVKFYADNSDGMYVECGGRIYVALWTVNYERIKIVEEIQKEKNKSSEKAVQRKKEKSLDNGVQIEKEKTLEKTEWLDKKQQAVNKATQEMYNENNKKYANMKEYEDFTRIYNRLGKIRIILDGAEYPAVKLRLHEMMLLPRSCWRMANNIFLMESYYRYGHILFMQYEESYILAVPWERHKKMEEQAKRFGFSKYMTGYEYGRPREKKLYWIKYL